MLRITARVAGLSSRGRNRDLVMPMPCSPDRVPPRSTTKANSRSRARLSPLFLLLVAAVEHDVDMDVAVPGVAEGENGKRKFPGQFFGEADQLRNPCPGHHHILADLVGLQGEGGRGDGPTGLPDLLGLDLAFRLAMGNLFPGQDTRAAGPAGVPLPPRCRPVPGAGGRRYPQGRAKGICPRATPMAVRSMYSKVQGVRPAARILLTWPVASAREVKVSR